MGASFDDGRERMSNRSSGHEVSAEPIRRLDPARMVREINARTSSGPVVDEHRVEFRLSETPWAPTAVVEQINELTGAGLTMTGLSERSAGPAMWHSSGGRTDERRR